MATRGVNANIQRVKWASGSQQSAPFDIRSQSLTDIECPDALTNTSIQFEGTYAVRIDGGSALPSSGDPLGQYQEIPGDAAFKGIVDEAGADVSLGVALGKQMGLDDQLPELAPWTWVRFIGVAPEGADRIFRVHSKEA